jgi:hypothetical protein
MSKGLPTACSSLARLSIETKGTAKLFMELAVVYSFQRSRGTTLMTVPSSLRCGKCRCHVEML